MKPAARTPHARANTGTLNFGAMTTAAIINEILNIKGVNAGKEKRSWLFCMPLEKATKEINAKYGNIILKISTAKSFLKSSK